MVIRHRARPDALKHQLLAVAYLVVGGLAASQRGYLAEFSTPTRILAAILAVLLWPLVVLGARLPLT